MWEICFLFAYITPLPRRKAVEIKLLHRTHVWWCVCKKSSSLMTNNEIFS